MGKLKFYATMFLLLFASENDAQISSADNFDRKNAIAADLAFTPSRIFSEREHNYYIHGALRFYPQPRVSIRGDASFSLREYVGSEINMRYHSIFFGACYHLSENGALDPYVGIQPGFSLFDRSNFNGNPIQTERELIPNASIIIGLNFYVNAYFNFFSNLRYVYGQPSFNPTVRNGLHEVRLAFGLGFNLAKQR